MTAVGGHFSYLSRFSRVLVDKLVWYTRVIPYSEVRIKDFGKSSQGTTCPSFSARSRNSRPRAVTVVLSRSKMPMMDESRTAKSLPIDKYIISPIVGEGLDPPEYLHYRIISIKAVFFPFYRIIFNIRPDFFIAFLFPYNMVMKRSLPKQNIRICFSCFPCNTGLILANNMIDVCCLSFLQNVTVSSCPASRCTHLNAVRHLCGI